MLWVDGRGVGTSVLLFPSTSDTSAQHYSTTPSTTTPPITSSDDVLRDSMPIPIPIPTPVALEDGASNADVRDGERDGDVEKEKDDGVDATGVGVEVLSAELFRRSGCGRMRMRTL